MKSVKRDRKGQRAPAERGETVRQRIISLLDGQSLSVRELSEAASVSEKDVYEHLSHIQKTVSKKARSFVIVPASCRKCGFVFRKRERMKKPGKCPLCGSESISGARFSIR